VKMQWDRMQSIGGIYLGNCFLHASISSADQHGSEWDPDAT
jgi:hypothetical protein